VFASLGRETAMRNAVWDACQKYPAADAITNFDGDSRGNSVYYSGVVVQWTTTPTTIPPAPAAPASTVAPSARDRLRQLEELRTQGLITEKEYQERRRVILKAL